MSETSEVVVKPSLKVQITRSVTDYHVSADWPSPESFTKKINYVMRRDGIYEVRNSPAGTFIVQLNKFTTPMPGFPDETNRDIGIPHYGKVPNPVFEEIVAFFKAICDESKDEAYVQTFWNPEENRYYNHVPEQEVSGASVRFTRNQDLENTHVLVLETHSHNTMKAFFSSTDNADEKNDRFYAVVGELNQARPTVLFSFVCGGKRIMISREDIVEGLPPQSFPDDWKSRIKKITYVSPTYMAHTGAASADGKATYSPGIVRGRGWNDDLFTGKGVDKEVEEAIEEAEMMVGLHGDMRDFFARGRNL